MDREKLKEELIRDEGKRLQAYPDSLGFWTIGIGHLLGTSPRMTVITEAECSALYAYDVAQAEYIARACVPLFDQLSDDQQRALTNMAFNRGEKHMRESSKIVPAIRAASENRGTWGQAADEIRNSPWAAQVKGRATRLADQFLA